MKFKNILRKKRGFTLVELIVVMSVIGVLAVLAVPRFLGRTQDANAAKHVSNVRTLEDASERYFIDHGDWPRLTDDAYSSEEINDYAERVRDITGEEIELTDGDYYDIDYEVLKQYVSVPDVNDLNAYVLRNPVGKIYHLEGLNERGASRVDYSNISSGSSSQNHGDGEVTVTNYPGNSEPVVFHENNRVITWDGNLTHREITINARGQRGWWFYLHFYNDKDERLAPVNADSETITFKSYGASEQQVIVPEEATRLEYSGSGEFYFALAPSSDTRPTGINVHTSVTNSHISFEWNWNGRVVIRRDGELLADIEGDSFEDGPLYPGADHTYEFYFVNEAGNAQAITVDTRTTQQSVAFRGIDPMVFDGNLDEYVQGRGTVTWIGDLSGKELEIKGRGGNSWHMHGRYYDEDGQLLPNNFVIRSFEIATIRTVVPEGAASLVFTCSNNASRLYNIRIVE